jgi:hypothetical protein
LCSKDFRVLITHSVVESIEEASSKFESIFEKSIDNGKELDKLGHAYELTEKCTYYAESILKEVEKFLRKIESYVEKVIKKLNQVYHTF